MERASGVLLPIFSMQAIRILSILKRLQEKVC